MTDTLSTPSATRRVAIGAGAAAMASLATRPALAALGATRTPLRFDDPIWNREAAARLQSDTTGQQVYGRCFGAVNGVRPGEAVRHLLDFHVFSTIRVLRQPDGNYQRMCKEVIFYADPKTGDLLDEWDNPYTGERVRVVDVANDPYNWVIADTVQPPAIPGAVSDGQAVKGLVPYKLHWSEFGPDTIVLTEDFHGWYSAKLDPVHWPRESPGPMNQSSELFRYFISRAALEDPSQTFVTHNGSWVRVQPWLPWMLMGQSSGHILYDGLFHPSRTTDYIPPAVLARVKARHPEYMTAPMKWYGPSLGSLEHYALEQTPAPPRR